jgi:hypothetical protein
LVVGVGGRHRPQTEAAARGRRRRRLVGGERGLAQGVGLRNDQGREGGVVRDAEAVGTGANGATAVRRDARVGIRIRGRRVIAEGIVSGCGLVFVQALRFL